MLPSSGDAVSNIARTRWMAPEALGLNEVQLRCISHGAFLPGIVLFDHSSFDISPAEAASMDPQQRMLLELGYEVLARDGFCRATLLGSDIGVFLGSTTSESESGS